MVASGKFSIQLQVLNLLFKFEDCNCQFLGEH
uniref:Uncharacterized protein n=1 Tax=Arundo donax TaxID=35708 RepID=A0A0A8ZVI3_ARUDO